LKPFNRARTFVVADPELTSCQVQMYNLLPPRPPTTTKALWRTSLVEDLGNWILDRRLEERVKKGEASYQAAGAGMFPFFKEAMMVVGYAEGEPDKAESILEEIIVEIGRAREYGFTKREMELAKSEFLAEADRAERIEPSRSAQAILMTMNQTVTSGETMLSAAEEKALTREFLSGITLDEVNDAFEKNFAFETAAFAFSIPEKEGVNVPEEEELLAAVRAALSRKTAPLEQESRAMELLAEAPEPGRVMESSFDEDLKVTSAWLENGVRMHHRFMDYKKDTLLISISLAGGRIEESGEKLGVTQAAALAFMQPATCELSSMEISDLMTGKNVQVSGRPEGDALSIYVMGSPKDIETGLKLVHILLTGGLIEETAFTNWQAEMLQQLEYMQKVPEFRAFEGMLKLLSADDPRVAPMTEDQVKNQTIEAAQAWFERLCLEAPIEVAVVGEMPLKEAQPLIERYIGSLPGRERSSEKIAKLRQLSFNEGPLNRRLAIDTITPKSMIFFGFRGADPEKIDEVRALNLASQVLSTRVIDRIREEKGLVYSMEAQNHVMGSYEGFSLLFTGAPADPAKADEVVQEAEKIFNAFAEAGPETEELKNAKKQTWNNLDIQLKEPAYWWQILQHLELRKRNLKHYKGIQEAYEKITAEQIRDVFRKYYCDERRFLVIAEPLAAKADEKPESEKEVLKAN
jgi:zinc protease